MRNSRYWHSRLMIIMASLLMVACSQQQTAPETPTPVQALPFSVVSSGDARADLSTARTFSWAPGMQVVQQDSRMGDVQLQSILRDAIYSTLIEKGYQSDDSGGRGDLQVGYIITLSDTPADKNIAETYGVEANINLSTPDPALYEKGTLVIDIIDVKTGLTAWRSALQGFASFQISEHERRQRINDMVQRMLSGLPDRYTGQ